MNDDQYLASRQAEPAINEGIREQNYIPGIVESRENEGWVIDPADGERVYQTGRGRVSQPDYQVSYIPEEDDDTPVRDLSGTGQARRINNSKEAEADREQLAYYQEQYRQREQAQPDVADMSLGDAYKLIELAKKDRNFQQFYENYDQSKSNLQLTPQQQATVAKIRKAFGSSMSNGTDPGISTDMILAAIEHYGLAKPGKQRQSNQNQNYQPVNLTAEQRASADAAERQIASAWGLQDNQREYDNRIVFLGNSLNT